MNENARALGKSLWQKQQSRSKAAESLNNMVGTE